MMQQCVIYDTAALAARGRARLGRGQGRVFMTFLWTISLNFLKTRCLRHPRATPSTAPGGANITALAGRMSRFATNICAETFNPCLNCVKQIESDELGCRKIKPELCHYLDLFLSRGSGAC